MKSLVIPILAAFCLFGCATNGGSTNSTVTDVQNGLNTVAHVLQQLNTGLQTAAPTVSALLTLTHNQGDAAAVNSVASESAAFTPALQTLLTSVQTAIASSTTPTAQIAAVNTALSPATVSAIVAPIATATSTP